jgi:serine/threonine protein kinase
VILEAGLDKLCICIEGADKTCYWLLKEVISRYSHVVDQHRQLCQKNGQKARFKKHLIAAIKSTNNNESLDYYLTLYDRPLSTLPANLTLEAYFSRISDKQARKISPESFQLLKVIGRGGFSKVFLVRKKDSGLLFAMKLMEKDFIRQDGKFRQVMCERKIMEKLDHPFIVKLHYAFQTEHDLSFVMDLCAGGELFYLLHQHGRLSEDAARFYFAEILLGLEYLHDRQIVYRDMKPENVLIDIDGHLKLADFGLSKTLEDGELTNSFCGSPEYMSPEVLINEGHSFPVDFYALGAILFEMITGLPPHYDQDRDTMYRQIV